MRADILSYLVASALVVLLNSSVNYFDPFNAGFGNFSTAVGTSTTGLWIAVVIVFDAIYGVLSFRFFRKISKSR